MTTTDMINTFVSEGMKAIKKLHRNTAEGRKIENHIPIEFDGQQFTCWKEIAIYKTAEYLLGIVPEADITVELEGNNSNIEVKVNQEEERKLNQVLYNFLKNNRCLYV